MEAPYGAEVIVVQERDAVGGFLGSRLKKIGKYCNRNRTPSGFNQYANIANKNVHAEQTANEIAREFDKLDWFLWAPARPHHRWDLGAASS